MQVEEYIAQYEGRQREILEAWHHLIMSYPGVTSKIRYRIPFYDVASWICYLNPVKGQGVECAFVRARELSNAHGILDFKGRKQVGGVTVFDVSEIPLESWHETMQEALLLDAAVPYQAKIIDRNNAEGG